MRGPNFSVHNFACPDCGLNCQLIQDGPRASMRHQKPPCKTYTATKKDGQKFLELAYIAIPIDKPDPVIVAFRASGREVVDDDTTEPGTSQVAPTVFAAPPALAAELAEAAPRVRPLHVEKRLPDPPRWQPLFEQLASELRGQIYDRGEVSARLAQALIEAKPGDTLQGFDDTRIAGIAQAIVALCSASKGHP